jgi:hypothetical protein
MYEPGLGPATSDGYLQCVRDELGAHVLGHGPPNNPARIGVLDGGEIEPPLPGPEIGDVSDPQDVRGVRLEASFDEVIGDPDARHADRGAALLDLHQPRDPGVPHQPADPFARDDDALAEPKLGLHPARAIDPACVLVDLLHPQVSHASLSSRSLGTRRSHEWNPDLETPRVSHITETGKPALSAEMIR